MSIEKRGVLDYLCIRSFLIAIICDAIGRIFGNLALLVRSDWVNSQSTDH